VVCVSVVACVACLRPFACTRISVVGGVLCILWVVAVRVVVVRVVLAVYLNVDRAVVPPLFFRFMSDRFKQRFHRPVGFAMCVCSIPISPSSSSSSWPRVLRMWCFLLFFVGGPDHRALTPTLTHTETNPHNCSRTPATR